MPWTASSGRHFLASIGGLEVSQSTKLGIKNIQSQGEKATYPPSWGDFTFEKVCGFTYSLFGSSFYFPLFFFLHLWVVFLFCKIGKGAHWVDVRS